MDCMNYRCPRWAELPDIPLYLDQLIMVIENAIGVFSAPDEPAITKTMINNYVKSKLIAPPTGKKYSRSQISRLIQVSLLKRVFSMNDILLLLSKAEAELGAEQAYNFFCNSLENYIQAACAQPCEMDSTQSFAACNQPLLEVALQALVNKLYVQNMLAAEIPVAKLKRKTEAVAKKDTMQNKLP